MPYVVVTMIQVEIVPGYKEILVIFMLGVLVNMCLNLYWSYLIFKQVLRIFKKGEKAD
jgi:hypothetical protein